MQDDPQDDQNPDDDSPMGMPVTINDDVSRDEVVDPDPTTEGLDVERDPVDPLTELSDDPYRDDEVGAQGSNDGGIIPENEARSEGSGNLPADALGSGREDEGTE